MKQVSGKDFCRIVERRGWTLMRINGSHHIYGKAGVSVRLTIPVHANSPLKLGLLRSQMRHAGMTEADL